MGKCSTKNFDFAGNSVVLRFPILRQTEMNVVSHWPLQPTHLEKWTSGVLLALKKCSASKSFRI